jgi:hypothetical protein
MAVQRSVNSIDAARRPRRPQQLLGIGERAHDDRPSCLGHQRDDLRTRLQPLHPRQHLGCGLRALPWWVISFRRADLDQALQDFCLIFGWLGSQQVDKLLSCLAVKGQIDIEVAELLSGSRRGCCN